MSSVFVRNSSIKERKKAVYNGVNRQAVLRGPPRAVHVYPLARGVFFCTKHLQEKEMILVRLRKSLPF